MLAFDQEALFFGESLPMEARMLMQEAIDGYDDTLLAEASIKRALEVVPDNLELHIAQYKFYFYKNRLRDAEQVARQTLELAARQGGFAADWTGLGPDSARWGNSAGAERVYLFTLKALSFMRLRQSDPTGARSILNKLRELDPEDQVGSSVIAELAGERDHD